jgi:predicted DNA binding protein/putative methionine-R-sulfoxide reductase with GAF domain
MATVPVVHGDRTFGAIDVYKSDPDAFGERELAVLGELGETIGYAIAAVERRERERTLTALYEATRDLLGTETEREVCDVVVDVATEVLDVSEAGIFLFDDEENVLRPVSSTESFLDFYGGVETFGPGAGDSETWRAYMTGQTKVFDDVSQAEHVADPDTDARGLLVRPLDEHGTLVAASTEVGVFDSQRRKLVGLLAATAEAALDRVTGKARLRERDRQLEERARRLERFAQVAGLSRDVCRVAVDADDREALERGVCERLVRTADVAFAWVGTVSPDGVTLAARAWAGDSEGYLDATSLSADGTEPAARAAATGEVTVVSNVTDYLRDHDWARAAADRGYQSIVAVPLAYRETTYGVLTAYATDSEAFDDATDLLADLGDLVAYASNAVETERGVLADRVTELELRLGDGTNFLNAVADQAGTPVRSLGVTPRSDGRTEVLFGLDDAPVEAVLALDSEFVGVETLEHVGTDGRDLFRATLSGQTVAATLLDCGAVPETVVARPGHTDAVVSLPRSAEARVFFDRLEAVYPGAKLLARHDRSDHGDANARGTVDADLTDRQREVLETAFESGFFESPRETTGSELADILGVSQPTVTHHLREGQRRLFATLYGED